ncbi:MAG: Nramp family divalent metal transporter [Pelagibacterales bacterium]|jgi:Mn2+/Fe2+ NRAMP family transporter|nr:Nramp family divalent metal transporter [Pelagibacterales bacterium]MDG1830232.1 Nramp family divalent metal transporter [Flavobacteriaceae bacterium]
MISIIRKLGPGLLFAGAAIGVSHLVQSTRAGADFGFGLLWALILSNLFKYPFFLFGPKYSLATNESLLDGYYKLGKYVLLIYLFLSLITMFTIQSAVTIVTAGLAIELFGITSNITVWACIIIAICLLVLLIGKYKLLDNLMKFVIIILAVSTLLAVFFAGFDTTNSFELTQVFPKETIEIAFLVAFMGWMPAPLDVSVWQSIWTLEKKKKEKNINDNDIILDFNIGYLTTIILGICFIALGAFVMYGSGESFSNQGGEFAKQLINLYTDSIGNGVFIIIAIAAFTTMFSTTITCLDASPRTMEKTFSLLGIKKIASYNLWIITLAIGTLSIFVFFMSEMGLLVKIATILSFITAPFYAFVNFRLINSKYTPKEFRPSKGINILSIMGLIFLTCFTIWYLTIL